mgnify:CR=1 FL=1
MLVLKRRQNALRAQEAKSIWRLRRLRFVQQERLKRVARIAAIMASKRTSELIPLCHPIALTHVSVDFELDEAKSKVVCIAQCECSGQTGVEMEALTAVQVGLLTVYDMLKAVDRGMVMTEICLLEKDGGKSGHWLRS